MLVRGWKDTDGTLNTGWFQNSLLAEGPNTRELMMTVSRRNHRDHAETQGEQQWNHYHPKDGGRLGKRELWGRKLPFREAVTLVEEGRWNKAGWERSFGKYIVLTFLPLSVWWSLCNGQNLLEPEGKRSLMDRVSGVISWSRSQWKGLEVVNLEWQTADSRDGKTSQMKQPLSLRMTKDQQ